MSIAAGSCLAVLVVLVLARVGVAEPRATRRLTVACWVATVALVSLLAIRVLTELRR